MAFKWFALCDVWVTLLSEWCKGDDMEGVWYCVELHFKQLYNSFQALGSRAADRVLISGASQKLSTDNVSLSHGMIVLKCLITILWTGCFKTFKTCCYTEYSTGHPPAIFRLNHHWCNFPVKHWCRDWLSSGGGYLTHKFQQPETSRKLAGALWYCSNIILVWSGIGNAFK